ncbi:DUF4040 domain-containing protein [Motiliproteus coralliicola]|uniref:DUF4040 domain-containing protein n=1 Tax=Motiliproteus coralliicola TaxID=2283196 RepID=A0A369WPQ6_9GAMM|nr:hydrogenase subunit MbhD domain-containing protein [Motiliproteus coralliicola]RDE24060.1 DUF4040 domain-containing protein [Motiliproteus coralliicola]
MMIWSVIDILICALVVALAMAALYAPALRQRVMFFIAFGLVVAITWARLHAPDLALAEAIIGAGLTGAMLLMSLDHTSDMPREPASYGLRIGSAAMGGVLILGLMMIVSSLYPIHDGAPTLAVSQRQVESGVSHPVTAVLLNFRAWDTLLELAVLLSAALGILNLGPARRSCGHAASLTDGLARVLVPLLILSAGYLLWKGAFAPGGAFQAGAVLASAAVVIHLTGWEKLPRVGLRSLRLLLLVGPTLFVAVGLLPLLNGQAFLQYPVELAGLLILLIESAAMVSIAGMLTLVYLGGHPHANWPIELVNPKEPM